MISIDCEDKERWHDTGRRHTDFAVIVDRKKSFGQPQQAAVADKQIYVNRSQQQPQFYYNLSVLADTDTIRIRPQSILQMSVHLWTPKHSCGVALVLKVWNIKLI